MHYRHTIRSRTAQLIEEILISQHVRVIYNIDVLTHRYRCIAPSLNQLGLVDRAGLAENWLVQLFLLKLN